MLEQLGTSSANTTCEQLLNRFVRTCTLLCVYIVHAVHFDKGEQSPEMPFLVLFQHVLPVTHAAAYTLCIFIKNNTRSEQRDELCCRFIEGM
jgi:hypothetical protein